MNSTNAVITVQHRDGQCDSDAMASLRCQEQSVKCRWAVEESVCQNRQPQTYVKTMIIIRIYERRANGEVNSFLESARVKSCKTNI